MRKIEHILQLGHGTIVFLFLLFLVFPDFYFLPDLAYAYPKVLIVYFKHLIHKEFLSNEIMPCHYG